jgi:1,4-dihydroxy-2-naphthoate octaprenyltransferase
MNSPKTPEGNAVTNWILAARPKTLPASIVPVLLGIALSYSSLSPEANDNSFLLSIAILICAMLIQILTNFANDLFDFRKGADNESRRGPTRAVQTGLISEQSIIRACTLLVLLTTALGGYLVSSGGLPILAIGVFSILFAFLYTAGPFPLAYLGLGEVFVFLFFGPIAVWGTTFILTDNSIALALIIGASVGLYSSAILAANNLRDIDSDRAARKRTLAVRFGKSFAKFEYAALAISPSLVPIYLFFLHSDLLLLIPAICIFPAIRLSLRACTEESKEFQIQLLENTGKLLLLYGILLSLALLLH